MILDLFRLKARADGPVQHHGRESIRQRSRKGCACRLAQSFIAQSPIAQAFWRSPARCRNPVFPVWPVSARGHRRPGKKSGAASGAAGRSNGPGRRAASTPARGQGGPADGAQSVAHKRRGGGCNVGCDGGSAEHRPAGPGQRSRAARGQGAGRPGMTPHRQSPPPPAAATERAAGVPGASTGIGYAICADLLAQGHEVVSLALEHCPIAHPKLHSIQVDLTDRAATAQVMQTLAQRFALTTVVHNAGAIRPAPLPEVRREDLNALAALHLGCAVQIVQAALPAMRSRRFGRVVLLSSRAALGWAGRSSYSATKAGMSGMARTWALELAPEGITVNVVAPGPVRTDMYRAVVPAGSAQERALIASIPVQRLGEAADVARAVRFFTDAGSGFVTGQVLYVCGGTSVGGLLL